MFSFGFSLAGFGLRYLGKQLLFTRLFKSWLFAIGSGLCENWILDVRAILLQIGTHLVCAGLDTFGICLLTFGD